jgi:apolipoprotein N-acyltransferase
VAKRLLTLACASSACYDRVMATPTPPPPRLARLALTATAIHLVFDVATRVSPLTTPPYLQLQYMSELFRDMLDMLGVNAISVVTCFINGLIAAVFATALHETDRRALKLGALLFFIWLVTGGSTFALYLSAPAEVASVSLLTGLPRAAVLAWALDRLMAGAGPGEAPGE